MKVIVEGQLLKIYKKPDYTDKVSGTVTEGRHIAQLMTDEELRNNEVKSELYDISLPIEKLSKYKEQIGKTVQIPCSYFCKEKITFYGV